MIQDIQYGGFFFLIENLVVYCNKAVRKVYNKPRSKQITYHNQHLQVWIIWRDLKTQGEEIMVKNTYLLNMAEEKR